MDPVTGSALIGAGASLLGNLFGSKSQSDANKTNLKIAQMNNEFNERMMQKQVRHRQPKRPCRFDLDPSLERD